MKLLGPAAYLPLPGLTVFKSKKSSGNVGKTRKALTGSWDWILNILDHLDKGGRPPKAILDELVPEGVPVLIMEETSHSSWANSEALKRAGINERTENPPGGLIMKSDNGQPNGILLENAGDALWEMALDPETYPGLNQYAKQGLDWALKKIAKNGITSFCDARTYWASRKHHKIWDEFQASGLLTARTVLGLWAYPGFQDDWQIEQLESLYLNES